MPNTLADSFTRNDGVVVQINDTRYAGPVIAGRWQVMGSFIGNTYTVVDHTLKDLFIRVGGKGTDIRRFATKKDAEEFIFSFTGSSGESSKALSPKPGENTKESSMAKPAAVVRANTKLAASKKTPPAPAPKTPAKVVGKAAKTPAKVVGKAAKTPAPAAVPGERVTISSTIRAMITAGNYSDEQIFTEVRKVFPDAKIASNAVSFHRKKLEA